MTYFEKVVNWINSKPLGSCFTRKDLLHISGNKDTINYILKQLQRRKDIVIFDREPGKTGNHNVYQALRKIQYEPGYGKVLSPDDTRLGERKTPKQKRYVLNMSVDRIVYDYFQRIEKGKRSEVGNEMLKAGLGIETEPTGEPKYLLSFSIEYDVYNYFKKLDNRSEAANWILRKGIENGRDL